MAHSVCHQNSNQNSNQKSVCHQDPSQKSTLCTNDLDNWFDFDEKTIEIINSNLLKEDASSVSDIMPHENITDDNDNDEINVKYVNIDEIIAKCPNSMSSNDLIHHECSISYFVQVLMEGSSSNKFKTIKSFNHDLTIEKMASIVEYLKWISNVSDILAKRIGQDQITHKYEFTKNNKGQNIPVIVRSSYNFCTKYTQCKNFYSTRDKPCCKEHHYVHSLLKYDVDSVITFLEFVIKHNVSISNEDLNNLYLSIKTICFVARHMGKEISYIDSLTKNNSEIYHRNNPIDINKKKIDKKPCHDHGFSNNTKYTGNNDRGFLKPRYVNNSNSHSRSGNNNCFGFKKSSAIIKPCFKPSSDLCVDSSDLTNRYSLLAKF